ncbi:hypothetical protein EIP91_012415 [Steccherinum ochraceum]|uniref:BTB domain-containing protein n=1 Tax=Steccherinum ochraceum TaxID=92696 RepID=A0A4R0RG78_9APHY|nr:hypothetical protein EIP91_012415 [Steccherinum ochraceum]
MATTTASDPFNKSTDLILRSSDSVDFHVWSIILKEASPMFDTMLGLPQPAANPDVPVVPVTEDSATLRGLLELCYPMTPSIMQERHIDTILRVLEAAMKYGMEWSAALVAQSLKELADNQPVRVYAVAQRHGMQELAQYAARVGLKKPLLDGYCSELEDITGAAFYRLVQYREKCSNVLRTITEDLKWLDRPAEYMWFVCQNPGCEYAEGEEMKFRGCRPKRWWVLWMDHALDELEKRPCRETALTMNIEKVLRGISCVKCLPRAYMDLSKLKQLLAYEVDRKLDEVSSRSDDEFRQRLTKLRPFR